MRSTSLNGEPPFVNAWEMKSEAFRISPIYFTEPPFMKPLALIFTACLTFLLSHHATYPSANLNGPIADSFNAIWKCIVVILVMGAMHLVSFHDSDVIVYMETRTH